jgi:uncharacterized protein YkwD
LVALGCSSSGAPDEGSSDWTGGGGPSAGGTGGTSPGTGGTGGAMTPSHGGSGARAAGGDGDDGGKGAGAAGGASATGGTSGSAAAAGADLGVHTNPLSKDLISAFVAAHNAARARTDLNPLPSPPLPQVTWDPILADAAYNYLTKCVASPDASLVEHNMDRTSDYQALGGTDSYVGENIYGTTGTTVAPADAVEAWMSEATAFNYSKPNYSAAGHYSQVVWRASVRIGCAIVNCPNAHANNTVLCNYAPGGNIPGQKPY